MWMETHLYVIHINLIYACHVNVYKPSMIQGAARDFTITVQANAYIYC